ncbi:MAG: dienelactone hydrolase family protein [Phycisphaeraceae bacterium JB051]
MGKNLDDYLDRPFEYIVSPQKIRQYALPSLLAADDGKPVANVEQWENRRRMKLLDAFRHHVYGTIPMQLDDLAFERVSHDPQALDGKADFRIIRIKMTRNHQSHTFDLELYTPKTDKPVPAFLLVNNRRRTPEPTDPNSGFFPARKLIEAGFAACEFNNKQLAADNHEHFHEGVLRLYPELLEEPHGPRTISAWALGVIRCVDYLVQDDAIDAGRISVVGHSRGGKTALWAAVNDPRIAMTCPNNSGCTGTAIARRQFGETIKDINNQFPHWFNDVYKQYNDREDDLPVDQHMLVALMAPRSVCVGSAIEDHWADPEGEYLSLVHASPVYKLYGLDGLSAALPVSVEKQVLGQNLSYHIRHGGHGLEAYDWQCYMNAAREFLEIQ